MKMITILMMSAKTSTLDFLNIKVFLNESHDIITFVHDLTIKILSRD